MSDYNRSDKYKRVEVYLTDKQYRYLQALNLLKGMNGISEVIRNIVEEYRKNHTI